MKDSNTMKHPSFGLIQVSRVSGQTALFDSAVKHGHFVAIRVCRADYRRDLSQKWMHPRERLIEVFLSEAQFARMICSIGDGIGTPCTLHSVHGEHVPEPPVENVCASFEDDIQRALQDILRKVSALKVGIDAIMEKPRPTGPERQSVRLAAQTIERLLCDLPFIQAQFDRAMDDAVQAAHLEVEAHQAFLLQEYGARAARDQLLLPVLPESDN